MRKSLVCFAMIMLYAPSASAEIIFYQGFEDGQVPTSDQDGFRETNNHCCEHSIQNVETFAAKGKRSLYTLVRQGDTPVKTHIARAHLSSNPGGSIGDKAVLPHRMDRWFGFSVLVPKGDHLGKTHIFDDINANDDASRWRCTNEGRGASCAARNHGRRWRRSTRRAPQ